MMILVISLVAGLVIWALSACFSLITKPTRREVQRRNDRAIGRNVPARCPVGWPTCIRARCEAWDDPTGCQHPRREELVNEHGDQVRIDEWLPATLVELIPSWKSGGGPWGSSEPTPTNEPAEEALTALTAQERREVQRQIERLTVAARRARELFARLESGIDANDVPCAIRELDALKQECVTLAAYLAGSGIDVDVSGVIRGLDDLKLQFTDSRNYHPRALGSPALIGAETKQHREQDCRRLPIPTLTQLLDRHDVLVIDVETTGLGARAEVLAVAAIDTTGRVLIDTVSLPQGPITRGASDVHWLTRARLRAMGARAWPEVHAELAPLLEGVALVIAWNAQFDRGMLEQTSERHGLILPAVPWRCAMNAEADTRGNGASWITLIEAAERLSVPVPDAHVALADARTTLACVRALAAYRPVRRFTPRR